LKKPNERILSAFYSITHASLLAGIDSDYRDAKDIVTVFDKSLNYLFVNKATCIRLSKKPYELIGENLLELYPEVTASENHRNLLRAINGEILSNRLIRGKDGFLFTTHYEPLIRNNNLIGVKLTSIEKQKR
jgi:PAS domain-containing protein